MRLLCHFLIASTLCLFGLGSTGQSAEHIKDNLGLFSEQAINAANQQIAQLYKKQGWMIAIETRDAAESIPSFPQDKSKQDGFLTSWTTKNYVENKLQGIYLVIFKNPSKYRFHIDTDQQKKMGITQADINSWSNLLQQNLRVRDFDAALLSTVGGMSAKLSRVTAGNKALAPPPGKPAQQVAGNKQLPAGQNAPEAEAEGPSILMWILIAVGVFILFRIVRSVMSSMSNSSGSEPGGTPNQYGPGNAANMGGPNMGGPGYGQGGYGAPGGGRGGGLMSGMLGGLFGGMAGGWMYDKMSGGQQAPSDSGQGNYTSHSDGGGSLADNSSSQESDSTTFGGDWGNDSGGDSGGGGDFGGGDGGGDW